MCGRYTLKKPAKAIELHFKSIKIKVDVTERYNIAPTQKILTVVSDKNDWEFSTMRWGLIPSWAKEGKTNAPLINARAETIHEKPSFKNSFKSRRCLIPADGFYEWVKTDKAKTPYHIHLENNKLFAFAGIWAEWKTEHETIQSAAIITTEAHPSIRNLHHRMPVILAPEKYQPWLDPSTSPGDLAPMLCPWSEGKISFYPVSPLVNRPKSDQPECIVPA